MQDKSVVLVANGKGVKKRKEVENCEQAGNNWWKQKEVKSRIQVMKIVIYTTVRKTSQCTLS
jgi:hypothetical protein